MPAASSSARCLSTMRLERSASFRPCKLPGSEIPGLPLLSPGGARVVLGWTEGALADSIEPSPSRLFGPRGACLHPDGSLWVCDTGHHRLLGWRQVPTQDNQPADILIGQPEWDREGRNARGQPGRHGLNVPSGICAWKGGLAVADAWNHRVLLWRSVPNHDNQPPDLVLGQPDFASVLPNRGLPEPGADTLNWPYGVAELCGLLAVADTGNRRVLLWPDAPGAHGAPAACVLGQADFRSRDENGGREVSGIGMRWPHGLALWQGGGGRRKQPYHAVALPAPAEGPALRRDPWPAGSQRLRPQPRQLLSLAWRAQHALRGSRAGRHARRR